MPLRHKVLAADVIAGCSAIVFGVTAEEGSAYQMAGMIQFPIVFGAFWLYLARLKCPSCKTRLTKHFSVGSLPALPFTTQLCKSCGKPLR